MSKEEYYEVRLGVGLLSGLGRDLYGGIRGFVSDLEDAPADDPYSNWMSPRAREYFDGTASYGRIPLIARFGENDSVVSVIGFDLDYKDPLIIEWKREKGKWFGAFCGSIGATPGYLVLATRLEAVAKKVEETRRNWRENNPEGTDRDYFKWRFGKYSKAEVFELDPGD